jgi:hypothetical protein
MFEYTKKIINHIDKGKNSLYKRSDLIDIFYMSEKEYLDLLKYEKSLLNRLKGRIFDTDDYDFSGNYQFKFKLIDSTINIHSAWHPNVIFGTPLRLYFDILPGGIVPIDGIDLDINLKLISDHEWGWEIELEILDIFTDVVKFYDNFIEKSKLLESVEFYINYPE